MARRLIVVSNRLPVSLHDENGVLSLSRSNGGLATALAPLFHHSSSLWVGWLGLRRQVSDTEIAKLNLPSSLCPVGLTNGEVNHYYDQFSNGILWPLAHGLSPTTHITPTIWHQAVAVTKKFADAIEKVLQSADTIWIHDYHLLLLPAELRRRGIKNRIGFFLHTPFPPPEVVSDIPHARELLQSLLSTNVVGLQVARDVNRFHEACHALGIQVTKQPLVKSFPIGIDFDSFDSLNTSPAVITMAAGFKKQLAAETIILSMSRLDYTKGIVTQLQAFKTLISTSLHPQRIVYRLNVAPSRESVPEYKELRKEIEAMVANINKTFGTASWQPVHYTYENMGMQKLAAWYQVADIHLNLPVADGMNLVAKEYIAARRAPGILIISSTMGAADQLKDALIIPPENPTAAAAALDQALKMPINEKQTRWKNLRDTVQSNQATDWAKSFLKELQK